MDRFALFRLPSVAISEVMKKFHLFDLTILSMCSKKTQKWIKSFRPYRDDFEIGVSLCRDFNSVTITGRKKYLDYRITSNPIDTSHSAKFDDSVVPMNIETHERGYHMNLYFEDVFDGLKTMTEYFCSLFKKNIYRVIYNTSIDLDQAEKVMDWVLNRQKRFHSLFADCGTTTDDVAEYLFSKINIGEEAYISLYELSETFEADFKFEGESFTLYPCPWLTLENLLNINCLELFISESELTNEEMNLFLKHWIGSDLKFKDVYIHMNRLQPNILFSGIPVIPRTMDVERVYKNYDELVTMRGGFDIKRNDGKTATIAYYEEDDINEDEFRMIVWEFQEQ